MAGGGGEEDGSKSLEYTPTWAVATVVFVMILVSILIEHALHLLAKYFHKKRRKSLLKALDRIKSELMLLGFLSLLLTVCQKRIAKICIQKGAGENFLPCQFQESDEEEEAKCADQGKISLISEKGMEQLQYLIFILALSHVISCFLTFSLGMLKMKRWESWEEQTRTLEYEYSNDPRRFQFIHQTSFGRRHLSYWSNFWLFRLLGSFLRQFYGSVSKVDYFILRHGFIKTHFDEGSTFDFHKYLRKALEKDFGVVVRVSPWIWLFSVLFIFLTADKFRYSLWVPLIPLVMLLVVGTKLQGIITKMCLDSSDKSHIVRGTPLVRPSDHFFWFSSPKLLLHLIHFILVQNSYQLAFFAWTWYQFGLRSCFHPETADVVVRIATGVFVQLLCGYVTLPIYALVTQMGTSLRKTHVLPNGVIRGLKQWQKKAKKNLAKRDNAYVSPQSLEASLETSVTHSTSNEDSSSIELENSTMDEELFEIQILGDQDVSRGSQLEMSKKFGSFEGFHLRNRSQ